MFRATPLRQSTDNIGLARHASGTSLIRIGKPQRREFASWRYGSNFVARHRRMLLSIGSVTAATTGGALLVPGAPAAFALLMAASTAGITAAMMKARFGRVRFGPTLLLDDEGQYLQLDQDLRSIKIQKAADGWAIRLPYLSRRPTIDRRWTDYVNHGFGGSATLHGQPAQAAVRKLLPIVNGFGARARTVNEAVELAGQWSGIDAGLQVALAETHAWAARSMYADPGSLVSFPAPVRLALEMAGHEQEERELSVGELATLELRWREAEEIAAIADSLLLPRTVESALKRLRRGPQSGGPPAAE